jgi:hypothetical protein
VVSRRKLGNGLLMAAAVERDGFERTEWGASKVCRRAALLRSGVMLIDFKFEAKSRSSLLSDCTNGLVGGFSTKLDEYDEDKEGARDRGPYFWSIGGSCVSSCKDEKLRGGDVETHGCWPDEYRAEFVPKSPRLPSGCVSNVKSPLCRADRGRSIFRPACVWCSISTVCDFSPEISAGGSNGEEFEAVEEVLRGVSWR